VTNPGHASRAARAGEAEYCAASGNDPKRLANPVTDTRQQAETTRCQRGGCILPVTLGRLTLSSDFIYCAVSMFKRILFSFRKGRQAGSSKAGKTVLICALHEPD
jgi:hypothetical protein